MAVALDTEPSLADLHASLLTATALVERLLTQRRDLNGETVLQGLTPTGSPAADAEARIAAGDLGGAQAALRGAERSEATEAARARLAIARGSFALGAQRLLALCATGTPVTWAAEAAIALARAGDATRSARTAAAARARATHEWEIALAELALGATSGTPLLRSALARADATRWPVLRARAAASLGRRLVADGARAEAREPLREAAHLASAHGARALAAEALTDLRATGARPRRLLLSGVESLTPSERRVAELAARRLSNREIAGHLFVSVKTVESHLGRVFRKLDVTTRAELSLHL